MFDKNLFNDSVIINSKKILINSVLSVSAIKTLTETFAETNDYRESFVIMVYKKVVEPITIEFEDFLLATDEELIFIINLYLNDDLKLKTHYEKLRIVNQFERFYIAIEELLNETQRNSHVKFMKNEMENIYFQHNPYFNKQIQQINNNYAKLYKDTYQNLINTGILDVLQNDAMMKTIELMNNKAFQSSLKLFSSSMLNVFKVVSNIDFNVISKVLEHLENIDRKRIIILEKYQLALLSDIFDDTVEEIFSKIDEFNADDVNEIVIKKLSTDDYSNLINLCNEWYEIEEFKIRKDIINQIINSHRIKSFNLTTMCLIIHFDGIMIDFFKNRNKNVSGYKTAIEEINKELMGYDNEVLRSLKNGFKVIESTQYDNYTYEEKEKSSDLTRHKIAHGVVVKTQTEIDSIKCFLNLDILFNILRDI